MTGAADFLGGLRELGTRTVTSVPCSYFAGPLRLLEEGAALDHVPAANEGSALALAAGARLAGRPAAVLAQNSGFGAMINPLTSLLLPYRIPVLVALSMRGWPEADAGEPQHLWMGRVVPGWLDDVGVPYRWLAPGGPPLDRLLADLAPRLDRGQVAFLLVAKGAIGNVPACPPAAGPPPGQPPLDRDDVVGALLSSTDAHVVATTGYLSRSLFTLGDREQHFYMQGSMGHAAAFALGVAHSRPDRKVVVLDGDGAVIMHAGTLTTIGDVGPPNLVHLVFDNGAYESTGGQRTTSATTDLAGVARSSGYRHALRVRTAAELRAALDFALAADGPTAVVVAGGPGGAVGSRASGSLGVQDIARRFAGSLGAELPEPDR